MMELRLSPEIDNEVDGPIPFPVDQSNKPGRNAGLDKAVRRVEGEIDRMSRQLEELEGLLEPLPFRSYGRDDEGPRAA